MQDEGQEKKEEVKIPCLVYSRIVGYMMPIGNWHEAKRREFEARHLFDADAQDMING